VREAPVAFDRAMNRWRELYRSAYKQAQAAHRLLLKPKLSRQEKTEAERRDREARHEMDLLLNSGETPQSEFYPYRYLANEGFLPGYNFPRLPLRALVSRRTDAQVIERPRGVEQARCRADARLAQQPRPAPHSRPPLTLPLQLRAALALNSSCK
jgi:hypothetical protein